MNNDIERLLLHMVWTLWENGNFITALPDAPRIKIEQSELYRLSDKHGIKPNVVIGG